MWEYWFKCVLVCWGQSHIRYEELAFYFVLFIIIESTTYYLACQCLPPTRIWGANILDFFYMTLGVELRYVCLQGKHFTDWVISPARCYHFRNSLCIYYMQKSQLKLYSEVSTKQLSMGQPTGKVFYIHVCHTYRHIWLISISTIRYTFTYFIMHFQN